MSEPAKASTHPGATKPRSRRRLLIRIGVITLAVIVVFRLTLLILLPTVISRTARAMGLDCDYQRMKLSLLGTNASLWGVVVTSKDGTQQVLKAEYVNANISTLQLLRLRLVAFRLEAEGVEVGVERKADGSIPLLTLLTSQAAPAAAPKQAGTPKAPDFSSPLEIHALRLYKLVVRIKDETLTPPYEDSIRMDLRVTDLGRKNRPVRVEFDASSRDLFSSATVEANATLASTTLDADLNLSLRGLRADRLSPYLSTFGLAAQSRNLNVQGSGKLSLAASTTTPGALQGSASLSDITISADSDSVASLKTVSLDIASLSPSSLHLRDVQVTKGTIRAERTPAGDIRFAAFTPGSGRAAAPLSAAPTASPTPPIAAVGTPFQWRIDRVVAADLNAVFEDRAIFPTMSHTLQVSTITATDLRSDGPADTTSRFNLALTIPGIIGSIHAEASASPFQSEPAAHATIGIDAIRPEALKPYLTAMGIESTFDAGSIRFTLDAAMKPSPTGPMQTNLTLDRIVVKDQDASLFEFGPVKFSGISQAPAGPLVIDSVHGSGPSLSIRRLKDGRFELLGLRINPNPPATESAASARTRPDAAPTVALRVQPNFALPALHLNSLTWDTFKIRLDDLNTPDLPPIELTDAGIEFRNIHIADSPAPKPGTVAARFRAPNLLDSLSFEGTLAATTGSLDTQIAVRGQKLALARLAPYLSPFGIEPTLTDGTLSADLSLSISNQPQGARLSAAATNVAFTDGPSSLVSISSAGVDYLDLHRDGIAIGTARLTGLTLAASRDLSGLSVLGLKFVPQSTAPESTSGPLPDPLSIIASLGQISSRALAVEDARIRWTDSAAKSPIDITATINASLSGFPINPDTKDAAPGTIDVRIGAPGLVDSLTVQGSLSASGEALRLDTTLLARGLSTSIPATYLPPGFDGATDSGLISLKFGAGLSRADTNALSASVSLSDFDYRAQGDPECFAHLDSFTLDIARLDPASLDLHIRRISATGLSAAATTRPDGALSFLGLAVRSPSPAAPSSASEPTSPAPSIPASPKPQSASPAPDVRAIIDRSQRPPPLITIDAIDLDITRLSFTGPSPAVPIALADVAFRSAQSFHLLGDKPESHSPALFTATGKIDPLVGLFTVTANTAPFATEPSLDLTISASAINGESLTKILPDLASTIDGSSLKDARFASAITARAKVQRRGPTTIDWSRGIDLSLQVKDTEFRAGETLLAGVGSINADSIRIDPSTGNITAREVEVQNIAGNAWRDDAGIHILGLTLKLPAPDSPSTDPAPPTPPTPAPPPAVPQSKTAQPEIRIDRLTASGLDFTFDDRAVQPPVTIPFNALDADIRGLSSLILQRERPVRFNFSIGAGKVSLPIAGRADSDTTSVEDRDFFSQCIGNGTMAFYPAPRGRAIASINGVELLALRGLAKAAGASVGGGVFDGRIELRARDDGNVQARARATVTDLRYAEPPSGPIERFMALPVPIDAAITAIEAPDGSITLPVDVTLSEQGLNTGSLVSAVALAAGQIIATAVVSAPVKVVAGFAGLFGASDPDVQWVDEEPIVLAYPDGITALSPSDLATFHSVLERARTTSNIQVAIEHDLGTADAALTSQRANPSTVEAAALANDLRTRRAAMLMARAELLPAASAWAVGVASDTESRTRLQLLSRQLADLEVSMDQLYALQGPGAETSRARRARGAAVELIDARMAAVRRSIERLAGSDGAARIAVAGGRPIASDPKHSRLIIRVRQQK